jgi:adenosylhomocysteine nucleosidase
MAGTLGLVAAMEREVAPLLARLDGKALRREGEVELATGRLGGREVALARAGLGAERALVAARALLRLRRPAEILAVGFAGALRRDLAPGTLVLAEEVFLVPPEWRAERPIVADALAGMTRFRADERLLARARAAAERAGTPFAVGGLLTVARVLAAPAEKAAAGRSGLAAAEMESAAVAALAAEGALPFLAVRAISDGAGEDLRGLDDLVDGEGRVCLGKALARLLARPWRLPAALRLARGAARAAETLARFLAAFAEIP